MKEASSMVIGAGVVLLGYLVYKASKNVAPAAIRPTNPGGATWTNVAPGEFLSSDQMIYDVVTGNSYDTIPYNSDIFKNVASSIYGTK